MTTLDLALDLGERGFKVFPLSEDATPFSEGGFYNATSDPNLITDAWEKNPGTFVGVWTGESGIIVLDLDVKTDSEGNIVTDGFESLAEGWLDVPETFAYDSRNGLGRHLIYRAPKEGNFPRSMGYRGMKGVDRCSGLGYVAWMGGVPSEGEIVDAPEWLLDERAERKAHEFEGTLKEWYEGLIPGEPNALVRKAMERATERFESLSRDFSHSDIVEMQFEAVRLGAEGCSGVPQLLEHIEDLFMSREGAHSRGEEDWPHEFQEALQSAIEKYGDAIDILKNLPDYSIGIVPVGLPDGLVTSNTGKPGYSKLLAALVNATNDNDKIASILWNAPATKDLSRDWGLSFVYQRIAEARVRPEPTRENPRIEEKREEAEKGVEYDLNLLTDAERSYLADRPLFVDYVQGIARELGYDQMSYFESTAWNMSSMAFGLKGVVPVSATQRHGLNIWQIVPGWSGTGKSVVDDMQTQVLDMIMHNSSEEVPYDLGADSSIQGLHLALLQRDGVPSLFSADEASGWFKRLKTNDWTTGLEDTLADWYMGKVSASNKISLKELRGKSATTSFCLHMFATPDRLMETLTRDQFMTGFLARVMWTFGNPRQESEDMFEIFKESTEEVEDVTVAPKVIQNISGDLATARKFFDTPVALKPSNEVKRRTSQAYEKMYRSLQGKSNWDVIEPALTRHMEVMLKAAGISAMYRGSKEISMDDALHAIRAVEDWVKNLVRVADLVSQGDFQRKCDELEAFLRQSGGSATGAKIFHRFKNWIVRDAKEIDNVLTYLNQAGIVNRDESGGGIRYQLNGME